MKFDSTLDDHENLKRWREAYQRRMESGEHTRYSALTTAEKQQLLRINEHPLGYW